MDRFCASRPLLGRGGPKAGVGTTPKDYLRSRPLPRGGVAVRPGWGIPLLLLLLLASCHHAPETPTPDSQPLSPTSHLSPLTSHLSPSVTFILGTDHSAYNQYYTMANHYYRLASDERTDVVVCGLTSLSEVFDWLRTHPVVRTLPPPPPVDPSLQPLLTSHLSPLTYHLVNLVSHGNEFIDLQATVTPHGPRISAASLREALADSTLLAPGSNVVDHRTLVHLHGCAVGQNQPLLDALAEAFGGQAKVVASKLFEYYTYLSPNHNPQSLRHYYARTWYAFYHPDSAVDEAALVRQLQARYPTDSIDWRAGLRRRFQNSPDELYHYSFIVPVRYTEFYERPEDKPSVGSPAKRRQWVDSHPDFQALLDSTRIPRNYFQTKFYRLTTVTDDDRILLGLEARARAGVICLIQPLTDTLPSLADTSFFAFSR